MRLIWLLPVLLVLGGCPQNTDSADNHTPTVDKPAYPHFAAALSDENGFRDELKRLQGLYTSPANLGNAGGGTASSVVELGSRVEPGRVGLELHDTQFDERWTLWLWQDESIDEQGISIVDDGHTAGGYRLEFNIKNSILTVNVNARWLQGRFLQVSRELILGGLDHTLQLKDGYSSWEVDGPWMPYRMVPSAAGPYGVVRDECANGQWHTQNYPFECMVPSVGVYDVAHGMLLTVADDHPRRLDRSYTVGYKIPTGWEDGSLANLSYSVYNPLTDGYTHPLLFSGLPIRDSVVIEPVRLSDRSIDQTLIYAETDEIIRLLGQQVRCFHFDAQPPERMNPGGCINAGDWVTDPDGISEFLRVASGIWEVQLSTARFFDSGVPAGGDIGIGAAELADGLGVSSEVIAAVEQFEPAVMPVFADLSLFTLGNSPAYDEQLGDWYFPSADAEVGGEIDRTLDIRLGDAASWMVAKMSSDIKDYPSIAGYGIPVAPPNNLKDNPLNTPGFRPSYAAAAAAVILKTSEETRQARGDVKLHSRGLPNLAVPCFSNSHICADWLYGIGQATVSRQDDRFPAVPAIGELDHARRFAATVLWEVFGIAPRIDYGGTPAHQVIASARTTFGYQIHREYEDFAGFRDFAGNQRGLIDAGGDLLIVHSSPMQSLYTMQAERPAVCTEFVAILPADWESAKEFWVAFHGTGGWLDIDEKNVLTISWSDGKYFEEKLPSGFWVTDHPVPDAIQAGDVVLIKRKLVSIPSDEDSLSG